MTQEQYHLIKTQKDLLEVIARQMLKLAILQEKVLEEKKLPWLPQ